MQFLIVAVVWLCAMIHGTATAAVAAPQADPAEPVDSQMQVFLAQHCLRCHGQGAEIKGDVDLRGLVAKSNHAQQLADPVLLQDVLNVVESSYMPPEDEPQPTMQQRADAVKLLKQRLQMAISEHPVPSRTIMRRMNRLQYNNAVRDLFQLRVEVFPLRERMMRDLSGYFDPASERMPDQVQVSCRPLSKFQVIEPHLSLATPFPQDLRAEHGFDNQGDHLTLSPVLMESFIRLSRAVVDSPEMSPEFCGIWEEFFQPPDDDRVQPVEEIVSTRLTRFLNRAFRRPVQDELLQRYVSHVTQQLDAGVPFEEAMKSAAAAAIASPRFLYLYGMHEDETDDRLDAFELASRLSFFLWGTIPDDELFELAANGELLHPEVLREQTDRMLHDQRLKRFCDSFPSQWLQLERIVSAEPDPKQFPQFYFAKYRVSMHMAMEPLLLFETLLIENRSILQLIDSDFSYRSDLLEAWYKDGSQGRVGPPTKLLFRRVPVTDRRTGGVITSAATLTMTSGPHRTKPITRGAWLATVILNDPPPPPPADVPPLNENPSAEEQQLTLRERFVQHRENAACAVCHQRIDPLGFALENFNAAGIWREKYANGRSVDASGTLFGRHAFHDVLEFKQALLAEEERFVRAFAAHLLSYATGRPTQPGDSPSLDHIVTSTAADGYRLQDVMIQVVLSDSFHR